MARNETIYNAIIAGNRQAVADQVQTEIDSGNDIIAMMNESMIPAMREIGERFSRNEAYVPEMLIAARAMQTGLDMIESILAEKGHKARAKVCVGTVKGDLHDIGKNLVVMMLKGAGLEVMDLGVDCTVEKFAAAIDQGAQAVLMSALLTTTMPAMQTVIAQLKDRDVKFIVGGAPVTQEYANQIGAHGYGPDANAAVRVVEQCLGIAA